MSTPAPAKLEKPQVAVFTPQLLAIGVGDKPGQFKTADDLWRFCVGECGVTGISMHTGMLDVQGLISNADARHEFVEHYRKIGLQIVRLESHTDGQLASGNPVYWPRFKGFDPQAEARKHASIQDIEKAAHARIRDVLTLSQLLGINRHQTFCGGRDLPHHDQWSTLPRRLKHQALLFLAMQWEETLKHATACGVEIGFEIWHVMQTLQSTMDIINMRNFLQSDEAKAATKVGLDVSHPDKEEDDTVTLVKDAVAADIIVPGHAKSAFFDRSVPGFRHRQHGLPFKDQAGKFATFGIFNPETAALFGSVLWLEHARNPKGAWGVYEGECLFLQNVRQGLKVGTENIRRVVDNQPTVSYDELKSGSGIEPWKGPNFESFADGNAPVRELLEMSDEEAAAFNERAGEFGLPTV